MSKKEIKDRVFTGLAIIGIVVASIAFWELVRVFMWMCHEDGIPM